MDTIFRTFEASMEVLEGERAVVARINTSGVDRLKTVIDPMGCDVTHFNKTRSVLWNHGLDPIRGTVPIGQGHARVRRSERDMIGKTVFRSDDFSEQLFQSYKEGSLRGWSIKAGVHEASPPTREEIRSRPELEDCETIYRKWDLIEFSATPTPGNSDCLTMLVSRGLITAPEGFVPVEAKITMHVGDGGTLTTPAKPVERTAPYVEEVEGKWLVRNIDGSKIASFRTNDDAEDCIRAMGKPRLFEQIMTDIHVEQRARFEEQKEQLLAEIMLRKWGVI